ncbi:MAG: hypothetical protein ACR2OE_15020 [Thermomicrobiales bacterium]
MSTELHELFAKYDKMAGTGYDIDPVHIEAIERKITKPLREEIAILQRKVAAADVLRDRVAYATGIASDGTWKVLMDALKAYDAAPVAPVIEDDEPFIAWGVNLKTGEEFDITAPVAASEPESNYQGILRSSNGDDDDPINEFAILKRLDDLDKRLTQVTNSFTGHREWVKTEITDLDNRVSNVSNVHNSLAEMVHAMEDRLTKLPVDDIAWLRGNLEAVFAEVRDVKARQEGTDDPEYDDDDTPAVSLDACLERVKQLSFSKRQVFWTELQRRASVEDPGFLVKWPDVLLCVEREDWDAALQVAEGGKG